MKLLPLIVQPNTSGFAIVQRFLGPCFTCWYRMCCHMFFSVYRSSMYAFLFEVHTFMCIYIYIYIYTF